MNKQKQAFTLVELVIVIVILAILGTIAFISLSGYSTQARDSTRISDLSSMRTSLELFQLESGKYPLPTDWVDITHSGTLVWKQGTFGETVDANVDKLDKIPLDPLVEREYTYSLTGKGNEFQLGGIMEGTEITYNGLEPSLRLGNEQVNAGEVSANAYVTGNYNGLLTKVNNGTTCSILSVPSIITNDIGLNELQTIVETNSFVYRGYKNLPSSFKGSKFNEYGGFPFTPNKLVAYSDTGNCETLTSRTNNTSRVQLIKGLQDSYMGTILQNEGDIKNITDLVININNPSQDVLNTAINTVNNAIGGDLVLEKQAEQLPGCATQPTYTNATFAVGTPTQLSQQWQSLDSNVACYWTCGAGKVLSGIDCISTSCTGTTPNGTSEISNATSTTGGTWIYSTTPGLCTYICNTGYTRVGSSCNINTYTVSGSFGAGAGGATINLGGTNITADGSGNFSTTLNYGTPLSSITVAKTGYTCNVTTNGPTNLAGNVSNIAGNCIINQYTVTGNFGTNAVGASINVCGTNVTANSSGGFSASINHGSDCSSITITKVGQTCSVTTNGPAILTANVSNIAGSCTPPAFPTSCNNSQSITYTDAVANKSFIISHITSFRGCKITGYPAVNYAIIAGTNMSTYVLVSADANYTFPGVQWGYSGTLKGATNYQNGYGNTDLIKGTPGTAGYVCWNKYSTTPGLWYLPSKEELEFFRSLKVSGIGGFGNEDFWSSSEFTSTQAGSIYFYNGGWYYNRSKSNVYSVRCASRF